MLKLTNITKDYKVADTYVKALRGINLCFRVNEFVSILGPSGCGKTTMLNIIGGLDHATSGDLSIYGRSTKEYKDRDWDVYRNHRIGFIFQSYNLIPHQTVLGNVELALTISGMSKAERTEKAKAALDKVGLSDQYYKRPNQLSGGQCQRVAIARALVNDPEVLLADEPTGALDTVTSKQIMELVKEISKERLVIMVTHNPELAEEYSTRIIRMLDGLILNDTNPYSEEEEKQDKPKAAEVVEIENSTDKGKKKFKQEKAKMSFATAFKLSLLNLFTKKKRTIMTSVAGSIGIIGVSLVLSISIGLQGFINNMQNDMLTGNPIEIAQSTFDINSLFTMSTAEQKEVIEKGNWINVQSMIEQLKERLNSLSDITIQNKIDKNYVTYVKDMPQDYWSAIYLDYGLDISNNIYTNFKDANTLYPNGRNTSLSGIKEIYSSVLAHIKGFEEYASYIGSLNDSFMQAPDTRNSVTEDYVLSQYNVLYSKPGTSGIAKAANEVMIVLNSDRELADLTLGQIGYYGQDEFINIVNRAIGNEYDETLYDGGKISYDKIMGQTFTFYPNDTVFKAGDPDSMNPFTYSPYGANTREGGMELKVVGILEPKEDLSYGMLSSGIYYTTALAEYSIEENWNSELAKYMRNTLKEDSMGGYAMVYAEGSVVEMGGTPIMFYEDTVVPVSGRVITYKYDYTYEEETRNTVGIVGSGSNIMMSVIRTMMGTSGSASDIQSVSISLQKIGGNVESQIEKDEDGNITSWTVLQETDGKAFYLPNSIAVYPPDFTQKDNVLSWLDAWNEDGDITLSNGTVLTSAMREKIVYTDMLSLIMGMISSLISMITIALVGFTSLALIVSCVMIAIITYVSVVERIKEIGIIRSLGGRKRDVSNLFTAETFIIGLSSGIIGITVTYLLSWLVNLVVGVLGIAKIASFPWYVALIMGSISIGLTLISGLMPSKSAAKKDPVVALRTE